MRMCYTVAYSNKSDRSGIHGLKNLNSQKAISWKSLNFGYQR